MIIERNTFGEIGGLQEQGFLEPCLVGVATRDVFLCSIAISLKRLADHHTRPKSARPIRPGMSYQMIKRLRTVSDRSRTRPFMCNPSNTTMRGLERRGMIEQVPEKSTPSQMAWIITEAGLRELKR